MTEREDSPFGAKQMTFQLLEEFLIALFCKENSLPQAHRSVSPIAEEDFPDNLRDVIRFLEDNLDRNLRVSEIAAHFHSSPSTLKRSFAAYARRGIMETFAELKMARARLLIREGEDNFTQIAEALGFSSAQYFSQAFRRRHGMSPSEYRDSLELL